MPGVTARFYVAEIHQHAYGPKGSGTVVLQAVSRGDQNKDWASATPAGKIEMTINNPPAFAWFKDRLGEDVSLGFAAAQIFHPEDGHPYRESEAPPGSAYSAPNCGDCNRPEAEHVSAAAPA
jgi:hypothetical protein